jgi:hypothetical protein
MNISIYVGCLQAIADDLEAIDTLLEDRALTLQFVDGLGEKLELQAKILKAIFCSPLSPTRALGFCWRSSTSTKGSVSRAPLMLHDAMGTNMYRLPQPEWLMDSGASSHVTGKTGHLTTYYSPLGLSSQNITVGNGSKIPILVVGFVQISLLPFHLQNILVYISTVKNLISVR